MDKEIGKRAPGRCLWYEGCSSKSARAHAIQKSLLIPLNTGGHVLMPEMPRSMELTNPRVEFVRRGVQRKATVFTGLCNEHDNHIFSPMEDRKPNLDNMRHSFLLAYKAVLEQTHKARMAVDVTRKWLHEEEAENAELVRRRGKTFLTANPRLLRATLAFRQHLADIEQHLKGMLARKRRFDDAYHRRTYDLLEHERITLPEEAGAHFVAIGLINTAKFEFQPRESTFVSLNVLPLRRSTELLLSFLADERDLALPFVRRLRHARRMEQLTSVSRVVLRSCETLALRPSFYEQLPDERRSAVERYFLLTTHPALDPEMPPYFAGDSAPPFDEPAEKLLLFDLPEG